MASSSIQANTNISFGVEFDADVMCAVDQLEKDYVLMEVNSCDMVTETPKQSSRCHRKEKLSKGNVTNSSRIKTRASDVNGKSKAAKDSLSLTVIKGHETERIVLSGNDEAGNQDVACTWKSPLLVSTPVAEPVNERAMRRDIAAADARGSSPISAPEQSSSGLKMRTKKAEKAKLFDAILNNSLNAGSRVESTSPLCSCKLSYAHSSPDGRESSMASNAESKSWPIYSRTYFSV